MPTHGEYRAGHGFYDSSTKAWTSNPANLTRIIPINPGGESQRAQVAGWTKRQTFNRSAELDGMIRLRDSDRPEDRANYEKIAAGSRRLQIADYEKALRKAQADGTEIIDPQSLIVTQED